MSLYERIHSWLGRGETRVESPWGGECVFHGFPAELYHEIFKQLDVQSLRSVKAVCFPWATSISQYGYLCEKSITSWNMAEMKYRDNAKIICKLMFGKIHILDTGFRLNGILVDNFLFVMIFGRRNAFEHVTHLELTNAHIAFFTLIFFGSTFKNVESLILKDVYIEVLDPDSRINVLNLKVIKIFIQDKWQSQLPGGREIVQTPRFASLPGLIPQLEEYVLEFYDSPLFIWPILDQADHDARFQAFTASAFYASQTMQGNAKTLKSFSLKTFDLNDDRINGTKPNYHEQPMGGHDFGWINYLGDFDEIFPNLDFSQLKLEKLTLTFRLIQIGLPLSQRVLLALLRSQTSLKEFTLSQVYFPGDGAGVMQDLLTNLPANCLTNLEGIMSLRPNPNNPNDAGIPEPPIQGYFDSTVQLITQTVNLTLRFVSCQFLDDIHFFTQNRQFLKKIKVQQPGAHPANRIVLTDPDIQLIITRAQQLTVLWLEFCNMSAITDFGLTGISQVACARMLLTRDFELRDGDIVGSPISAITNLRSLNLSVVGDHVTDVTAHHGFNGLGGSLTSFGISSPKMTADGLEQVKRLFQYNQVVKFDARIKLDYSLPGEEIAA